MAFEYTPYRNPYIGTIADLMARGEDAKAKALIDVASAQARAAEAKGQIYGNAISSIGQDISKSLRDYNSPAAKQQREMDQAQAILKARGLETRQDERMRVNPGNFQPGSPYDVFTDAPVEGLADKAFSGIDFKGNLNPSVRTDATFRMVDGEPIEVPAESFNGLPSAISRSNVFGGQPDTTPSDGLSRSMAGVLGQTETRTSLPTGRKASLESYKTAPVGRYTTEQGMYDVKTAYNDLIQAGISPTVAGALAGQGQQANAIFAAFDKQKEDLAKTEVAMRGSIANVVLNTYKANPSVPIEDILQSVMGPAGNRIPAQDLEDFQVAMFGKPPQEQMQILQSLVKQWDAQGPRQVVNPGDYVMGASGNATQMGPRPVSAAEQEFAQNMSDWKKSGSKLPFNEWLREPAAGYTINGQRFDASGNKIGPVQPSQTTRDPVVAALAKERLDAILASKEDQKKFDLLPDDVKTAFAASVTNKSAESRKLLLEDLLKQGSEDRQIQYMRSSVKRSLPSAMQSSISGRETALRQIDDIQETLAVLRQSKDPVTGKPKPIPEGLIGYSIENVKNFFGTTGNPAYKSLVAKLVSTLQAYRTSMTGKAFSSKESEEYKQFGIDPRNLRNNVNWTDASIQGFKDSLRGQLVSDYANAIGGDMDYANILVGRDKQQNAVDAFYSVLGKP